MFIFVATNSVRPGAVERERRRVPGWVDYIRQHEPRLIAFHEFLSADGSEVEYVQVHSDVDSFEYHLGVLEASDRSYRETLEATTSIRIYGVPTESILATLRASVGVDVPITIVPTHLGGFTRRCT